MLENDGAGPTKIEYKKNLKIIIKDPEAGHKADSKAGPKADPPKAGTKADQKGHKKT